MNCATALESMLDAEPRELEGVGLTTVAAHIASCDRCGAVARRILGDTRLLAAEVNRRAAPAGIRRTSAVRVGRSLIPVGVVAALLVAVVPRLPGIRSGQNATTALLPANAAPEPSVPTALTTRATPVAIRRPFVTPVRAFPAGVSAAPVPIKPLAIASSPGSGTMVVVDPPDGRRVAVIRTDNPKFTVVWLY